MAAANTDKWRKKRSNFSTTLNGSIASGDTTINLNSTSGLPTDTAVTVTIDRVNSGGTSTPTLMERVVGVVSGNQLINVTRGVDNSPGPTQAHSSGAVVEDIWDALSWNDAATSFLVQHTQAGKHSIPADSLVGEYAVDGGSVNAFSVTLSPAPTALTAGMKVRFKASNANTSAATLNVNSLGATAIKKLDGATALVTGDIISGQIVVVIYDGTNFQMVSPVGNALGATQTATVTNKDLTSGTNTFPTSLVTLTGTQTLTNKRRTRRIVTTTQSATPTINTDNTDVASITALAQAITSFTTNLSGTPVDGDLLEIRITDNGTARAITWGASFESSGTVSLPTTTVLSTLLRVGFEWNTVTSKWSCIAVA